MESNKCFICDKVFSTGSNLNKHLKKIHNVEPHRWHKKGSLVCPSCYNICDTYYELRDHLMKLHQIDVHSEEKEFNTFSEFEEWKEEKEKELKCMYVKTSGKKVSRKREKIYYVCHRSFKRSKYRSTSQYSKEKPRNSPGSVKLTVTCPSTLNLIQEENNLKAFLYMPHLGHECITDIGLKNEKKHITGRKSKKVSFEKILDDIRHELDSDQSLEDPTLLSDQELVFPLQSNAVLHQNDTISMSLWIERLKNVQDELPLVFYKVQGVIDTETTVYKENDFVLMIMTSFQKKQLLSFGSDKIWIDSTHGSTNSEWFLTTLLVVDDFGEGVPCAFLVSNRFDIGVLSHFFEMLKEQVSDIKCEVFMSNDAPEFYNAWLTCMSVPSTQLLCTWHVDTIWRKSLRKIKGDQELKARVYRSIRVLMQITDVSDFNEVLDLTLSELLLCDDTSAFGEYFQTSYTTRPNMWAYCFRTDIEVDTDTHLETMHKILKYIYFQAKKNKRVDVCLLTLFKLVRDIMIKKLSYSDDNSDTIDLISECHIQSQSISINDICDVDMNRWKLMPKYENEFECIVERLPEECFKENKTCNLFCKNCQICVHEFSCSCVDFFIKGHLCKHIHAVVQTFFKPEPPHIFHVELGNDIKKEVDQHLADQSEIIMQNNFKESLKARLDILYGLVSSKTLSSEVKVQLENLLDKATNIMRQDKTSKLN